MDEKKLDEILKELQEINSKLSLFGWRIECLEKSDEEIWNSFESLNHQISQIKNIIAYSSGAIVVLVTILNLVIPALIRKLLGG